MKKWFILLFISLSTVAFSQTAALTDYCKQGATQAVTSGLQSTNYLQGIVPYCTVTVYLTGTTTLATIYSNPANTPLSNPFTAPASGLWLFYAAINQGYDITLSGGIPPAPTNPGWPVTLTGLFPGTNITVNGLPASAPLIGTTSGGAGQPVYLGANCSISGSPLTLNCAGATPAGVATQLQNNNGAGGLGAPNIYGAGNSLYIGSSSNPCTSGICFNITNVEAMAASWTLDDASSYYMKNSLGIPVFSVLDYGAVPDAITDITASMTASSSTVTITDSQFTSSAIGKVISVQGAGAGNTQLVTTITGFTDANHVTVATAASSNTPTGVPDPSNGLSLTNAGSYGYEDGSYATTTSGSGSGLRVSIYTNTGLATVTNITGGTVSGSGTCTVTGFNNGLNGATVTATYTSGSYTSAVITYPGFGANNGFTSFTGTLTGSGTGGQATCTGTATVTGTAGTVFAGTPMVPLGTGYAVGDLVYPTVPTGDGSAYFTVTQVDGAGAVWGTDNYPAWSAANTALQTAGGGRILIPYSGTGRYLVNTALGTNTITLGNHEIIDQDTSSAVYWVGAKSASSTFSFFYFVPSGGSDIHFWHNTCFGEWIVPEAESGSATGPGLNNSACINFAGSSYYNVTIDGGTFGDSFGHAISGSGNGSPLAPVKVHDVAFINTTNTAINLNTAYGEFYHNYTSFSEGMEIGADNCRIEYNTFYSPAGQYALSVGGVTGFAPTHGCHVAGNKIINPNVVGGMSLADGSGNSLVEHNAISGVTGDEIGIVSEYSGHANSSAAIIDDNFISGSGVSTTGVFLGPFFAGLLRNNRTVGMRNALQVSGLGTTVDASNNNWGVGSGGSTSFTCEHNAICRSQDYYPNALEATATGGTFTPDSVFSTPNSVTYNGPINLTNCLELSGSCGTSGQVPGSNGSGAAPTWITPTVNTAFTTAVSAPTFNSTQGSASSTSSPFASSNSTYANFNLIGKAGGNSGIYFGTVNAFATGPNLSGSWIGAEYNSNYSSNLAMFVGEVGNITAANYQSVRALTLASETSNTQVFASLNGGMFIGPTASSTDPGVNNLETYGNIYDLGAETSSGSNCLQINAVGFISNTGVPCGSGSGTITGVVAGTGLSGGGSSGSVTLTCSTATTSALGCVKPDGTSITASSGTLTAVGAVPNLTAAPMSDIICAHGSDTTIAQDTITGATNAAPVVFTVSTNPVTLGYYVGQTFQTQGNSPSAYNGTWTIGSYNSTTITATNSSAPGSAFSSGGTASMVCKNTTDALTGSRATFASTITLPAVTTTTEFNVHLGLAFVTSTTAPTLNFPAVNYNGTGILTAYGSATPTANTTWYQQNLTFNLDVPQSGWIAAAWANPAIYNTTRGPYSIVTSSPEAISFPNIYYAATGLGGTLVLTYSSGSSACTNGTQNVTTFNGGGTGGTGTITVSGGVPTGTITFTNTGYGYTSIPTTATVATCTGTATFTNSGALGGAQGNAYRLLFVGAKQF